MEWLDKQQAAQLSYKSITKNDFKTIYSEQPYSFQIDLTIFQDKKHKILDNMLCLWQLILILVLVVHIMQKIKKQTQLLNLLMI